MTDDAMAITERRKYLTKMHTRYRHANRQERSRLLTEMEVSTVLYRKSLTRLMAQSSLHRAPRHTQRDRSASPPRRRTDPHRRSR